MKKNISILIVTLLLLGCFNSVVAGEIKSYDWSEHYNYANQIVMDHIYNQINQGIIDCNGCRVYLGEKIVMTNRDTNEEYIYFPIITDKVIATLRIDKINGIMYSTMSQELVDILNEIEENKLQYFSIYNSDNEVYFEKVDRETLSRQHELKELSDSLDNGCKINVIRKYMEITNIYNDISKEGRSLNEYISDRTGFPNSKDLNIKGVRQARGCGNCWSATVATNVNYLTSKNLDDKDVSKLVKGTACSNGGSREDSKKAYTYYGIDSYLTNGTISEDEVKGSINSYKPLDLGLKRYTSSGSSVPNKRHAVSLYGYQKYGSGKLTYSLWDPARGYATVTVERSGNFVYGTNNGSYLWEDTISFR